MTSITVTTSKSIKSVLKIIQALPDQITGKGQDRLRIARDARARMALTLFQHVSQAFDVKSVGGMDEAGDMWPDLSPEYLAYKKGRPPVMKKRAAERGASFENGGVGYRTNRRDHMTHDQFRAWRRSYTAALNELKQVMPFDKARAAAANAAWKTTRSLGAPSLVQAYGFRNTVILVDTGGLRTSIEPGSVGGGKYRKKGPEQDHRDYEGMFYVGSINKKADYHHGSRRISRAYPGMGTVQRRLWPYMGRMPTRWWDEICHQGVMAIFDGLVGELGGKP